MKAMKLICLSLLVLTGILPGARGEDFRTNINPALLYYQAFLLTPQLSESDFDYLFTTNWQGRHLTERFGLIVSNYDAELQLLRQAARQKVPCDWGIDMSRGENTLLPYLASAKRAAQGAMFHAMWDLQNGNQAEARDDLLAALALGRNISRNNPLISALVEFAIESIVCQRIAEDFHRFSQGFSPETLQQLADGFIATPAKGTIAACAPSEKLIRDWAVNPQNKDLEQYTKATGGTIDGYIKLIRDSEPLYAQLAQIMTLPYGEYESRIQQFSAEAQKSGNPIFLQSLPAWKVCRRKEFQYEVDLAMVRAAIAYKLHGEAGLKSVMDPCGNGPFTLQRFVLDGVDRGFELKSALNRGKGPEAYIFVEKEGPPFYIMGDRVGQPIAQ